MMMNNTCYVCGKSCNFACRCSKIFYCSETCQKFDWRDHKFQCPVSSVQFIDEVKGEGLVANRGVLPSQTVLLEEPLISIVKQGNRGDYTEVLKKYKRLSILDQKVYDNLIFYSFHGNEILDRWYANSVSTKLNEEDEDHQALFPKFSKINHSCAPNCVFYIDDDRNMKVVAITKIRKGEEILITYIPSDRDGYCLLKIDRLRLLKKWDFTCSCNICSLGGQELARNEALKKSLIGLTEKQDENGTICDVDDARKKLTLEVEIVNIMKKLGLETVRDLPTSLLRCYLYSKVLQIQGVSLTYCPTTYRKAAYDEARILGDGFVKLIQGLDIKFDEVIGDVIRGVVAERKLQSYSAIIFTSALQN